MCRLTRPLVLIPLFAVLVAAVSCRPAAPPTGPAAAATSSAASASDLDRANGPAAGNLAFDQAAIGSPAPAVDAIATFSILGDIVHNVGGERVHVKTLVGPGGDAHAFEPSPSDAAALGAASIVFENGLGLDGWLDRLYAAAGSSAKRVVLTEGIAVRTLSAHEADPHVWLDVANVITMTLSVGQALSDLDPSGAAAYSANAMRYVGTLRALDNEIQSGVAGLPPERRKLVTNHDTFGYFAARYGFQVVGNALASASTEGAEPSAARMAQLVADIQAAGVPVIFTEYVGRQALIERIAEAAGVHVGEPLFTDALGEAGSDGETYVDMMRHNLRALVSGLAPSE